MFVVKRFILPSACIIALTGIFGNAFCITIKWDGPGGGQWNTAANWSPPQVPGSSDSVVFDNTMGQSCMLDGAATVGSINITPSYGFQITFNGQKLTVSKHAYLGFSSQPILSGNDTIEFVGAGNYQLVPPASPSITLPTISQNGIGTTTVAYNLKAVALSVKMGTFNLGSGTVDSIGQFSGSAGGTLDFGSSRLKIAGSSVDFSNLGAVAANSGQLEFLGFSAQAFIPKAGSMFPEIVASGSGNINVQANRLFSHGITINGGNFTFSSFDDSVGFIGGLGGSLSFNIDTVNAYDTVNLNFISSVNPGTGWLKFVNDAPKKFVPKNGGPAPRIIKSGSSVTTVTMTHLVGPRLDVISGAFSLGTDGLLHSVDTLFTMGGSIDFANCTLSVVCPSVNLASLTSVTPGTGALKFAGAFQQFWPSASSNPIIKHSGPGTLQLMSFLSANGFEQTLGAGTFNLGGQDVSIISGGNFVVNNLGPNSISGLGGRTISAQGNVYITGSPPSGPTVDLGYPIPPWNLYAGGQLIFDCVNFDSCHATGSPGIAIHSINHGGNVNWTFVKQWIVGGTNNWTDGPNWNPTGAPAPADSVVISGSTNCGLSMPNVTVKAITFLGFTGIFSFYTDTLTVLGSADFTGANVASGTGALRFANNGPAFFTPPPAQLWTIIKDSIGTLAPVAYRFLCNSLFVNNGIFDFGPGHFADSLMGSLVVKGGQCNFGSNNAIYAQNFIGTGGTLNFGIADTLILKGSNISSDFSGLANIINSQTSSIKFNSQLFGFHDLVPHATYSLPRIYQQGLDTVRVVNSLKAFCVTLDNGGWQWDSGGLSLTHQVDSIQTFAGVMKFGQSTVQVKTGGANFGTITKMCRGAGILSFTGSGTQILTPPSPPDTLPQILITSSGSVQLANYLEAAGLRIGSGAFSMNGKKVILGKFRATGGELDVGADSLTITDTADFSGLFTFNPGTGAVVIKSQNQKRPVLMPGNAAFNTLVLWNNGSNGSLDTIEVDAGNFTVNGDLIFRQNKATSVPNTSVWRFDIFNPSVNINGNISLEELYSQTSANPSLLMGSGYWTFAKNVFLPIGSGTGKNANIDFVGSTVQRCSTFVANPSDSLGSVFHAGNGTLQLADSLRCRSFDQTAGTFDLNGHNISTSGDFTVVNGTGSSFSNLGGATIAVRGNAFIQGSSASLVNLDPPLNYNMNVSGSFNASWARIGNSYANGSTGYAMSSRKTAYTSNWVITGMTLEWTGSSNESWKNPANWSPAIVPADSDNVVFDALGASHNCWLDTSANIKNISFNNGYSGMFSFTTDTLTVSGNADFSFVGSIASTQGMLRFHSMSWPTYQVFTPKAGAVFPRIFMDGGDGGGTNYVDVQGNPLAAGTFSMKYGTWRWGYNGATHTVQSLHAMMPSATMDFGNSTVRVSDSVYLGCHTPNTSGGTINLVRTTGTQCIYGWETLPAILHNAQGTARLIQSNLACQSFENDSGPVSLNGFNITANGDMAFATGHTAFDNVSGRKLTAGGRLLLNGSPGDSIVVMASTPACTLWANGPLTASYAVLGNCIATQTTGHAACSRDAGGNVNWAFVPAGVKKWAAGAGSNFWSSAANWLPAGAPTSADSVVFDNTSAQTCMLDSNGSARAITFAGGSNAMMDFSTNTLSVYGSADFSGCGYIMNSGGALSFNGNGAAFLTPMAYNFMPSVRRATGTGTLTITGNALNTDTLSILSGTLNLGTGIGHKVQWIKGNSGGILNFGTNTSLSVWGDADLSALTVSAMPGDSLIFNGEMGQTFSPPVASTNLTLVIQKNDTLFLGGANNLGVDRLVMYAGGLNLGTAHSDLANNVQCYGGVLNFGSSMLSTSGPVDLSGTQDIVPGTGALNLTGPTGIQGLTPTVAGHASRHCSFRIRDVGNRCQSSYVQEFRPVVRGIVAQRRRHYDYG